MRSVGYKKYVLEGVEVYIDKESKSIKINIVRDIPKGFKDKLVELLKAEGVI